MLGFDGMDPGLVRKWMDEGALPNMQKLARRGGFYTLGTTPSPESPTAWASFATGVNAGGHDIYDFLIRDARTYLPELGLVRREPPRFLFDYLPIAGARLTTRRGGTPFWVRAGREGVRASVLTVPMTFPPEEVPNGELLAGLPLPDLRNTMGTFSYFGTDLSRYEEGSTAFGGILRRLVFDDDDATTELVGPPDPIVRQRIDELRGQTPQTDTLRRQIAGLEASADLRLPIAIHWNHAGRSATIDVGDNSIHLQEGEWSQWINLDFPVNLFLRLHGMAQLYLISADKELQLYVSPINWKPDKPPSPMSYPPSLSADLYERLGPFRTLGWAEATWPLNEGRIDEKAFMEDLYRAFDDRAQVILERLDAHRWDLLVGVIESPDRVQHMMWRLIDPTHPMYDKVLAERFGESIENVYRRCDEFVGEVLSRIDPDTPVLIVSDHGFHSFRQSVNLNTWLVQQGYMTRQGEAPGPTSLVDLSSGQFWEQRGLAAHQGVRDGPRPDLPEPQGARGPGDRDAGRRGARPRGRDRREAARAPRPEDRRARRGRGLQGRRHLQGPVRVGRRRAPGRARGRLPRVVADDARRRAVGHHPAQPAAVERRPRIVGLPVHFRHSHLEPADHGR